MSATDHLGIQFEAVRGNYSTTHYAYQGGELAGHASVNHPSADEPHELAGIRVNDSFQGHGIGGQLLDHVIGEHGGHQMTLDASPFGNKAMNKGQLSKFYGSRGFKPRKNGTMSRRATP